jgi:hypothetical protein
MHRQGPGAGAAAAASRRREAGRRGQPVGTIKHDATPMAPGRRFRLPACCDPCADARTGSSVPHGCACAGGSRAPCDDDGCSAGTCACSRRISVDVAGGARSWGDRCGRSDEPRRRQRSTPVRPFNGTRALREGQTESLWTTACSAASPACSVRGSPRFPTVDSSTLDISATSRHRSVQTSLTCGDAERREELVPVLGAPAVTSGDMHNLWTKVWI